MVTIVWNPTGFYRIVALLKGMKFNADYYISHIVDSLAEWQRSQVGGWDCRLHVHADNVRIHTVKKVTEFLAGSGMKRAVRPPYPPHLAPCNFYLFGYIKGRLAGASFEEPDRPLQVIDAISRFIEKATLERVFQEWMHRLAQCCVEVGGRVEGA
jgi:transposase